MRLVLWSPNYWPEPTGIAPLATDAAAWLAQRGHDVEVVTPVPNYPERRIHPAYGGVVWRSERYGRVGVHRSWLRARPERGLADKALYELTSSTFALPNAVRLVPRTDVLVCVVPTLLAGLFSSILSRTFHKRFVLWVQDLVLLAGESVVTGGGSRALGAARRVEAVAASAAHRIIVCSPGFVEHFEGIGVQPDRIAVVLNWVDTEWIRPVGRIENGRPRFLYAGNLGFTQGLETLVGAARILGEKVSVEIVGAGNAADRVAQEAAGLANLTLRPPVSAEDYPGLLASSDVQLVIQRRVGAGANLPSKIASALASGRAIVASISPGTAAAALLRESGAAVMVEPESSEALAAAMTELADDPARRGELGRRGREYAERYLTKDAALTKIERALLS